MNNTELTIGVLGSTGFVGKNLINELVINNRKFVEGSRRTGVDARNLKILIEWIMDNKIDAVVNLAAQCGGIGANIESPADFWMNSTNIYTAVLEASRITKLKKLVCIGTICSYGSQTPVPFKEEYLMAYGMPEYSNMFYGMAKLNALIGAQAYKKQYGLNVNCLMPVNMYGPYDNFDLESSHVVPAMINKFIKNSGEVHLWGDGSPTREFLYASDFARAIIKTIDVCDTDEFINIGSGIEIAMVDLATKIAELCEFTGKIVWNNNKPNGQLRRCLDVSKASSILGFRSETSLEDGLKNTIDWYRNTISK